MGLIGKMRDQTGSAARILELGTACQVVIVQSQPLGMRNHKGDDMYALLVTVMAEGRAPYEVQIGNAVPAAALPLCTRVTPCRPSGCPTAMTTSS